MVRFLERALFLVYRWLLSCCASCDKYIVQRYRQTDRPREWALISFLRALPVGPNYYPKLLLSNIIRVGRISTTNLGGGHIQSLLYEFSVIALVGLPIIKGISSRCGKDTFTLSR